MIVERGLPKTFIKGGRCFQTDIVVLRVSLGESLDHLKKVDFFWLSGSWSMILSMFGYEPYHSIEAGGRLNNNFFNN